MIKIVSGISFPGGSTIAHINLCNLFNEYGYDCTFYGPHVWHLDKCRSGALSELKFKNQDIVLVHSISLGVRPDVSVYALTCHETYGYPLKQMRIDSLDFIHYVSQSQKDWHGVDYRSVVIPNVVSNLEQSKRREDGFLIGGIIGNIDSHKQTDISINRALEYGCDKILLYGNTMDNEYFKKFIAPILVANDNNVKLMGYEEDRQKIYNSVDIVFHSSKSETFNYIQAECLEADVKYNGLDSADSKADILDKSEILEMWSKTLKL